MRHFIKLTDYQKRRNDLKPPYVYIRPEAIIAISSTERFNKKEPYTVISCAYFSCEVTETPAEIDRIIEDFYHNLKSIAYPERAKK